jgi:hypothetical protein
MKFHLIYLLILEKGTIKDLLIWIKDNILAQSPELFLQNDSM